MVLHGQVVRSAAAMRIRAKFHSPDKSQLESRPLDFDEPVGRFRAAQPCLFEERNCSARVVGK